MEVNYLTLGQFLETMITLEEMEGTVSLNITQHLLSTYIYWKC